jgi:predicted nucleotidyltransferase component of viral defense system
MISKEQLNKIAQKTELGLYQQEKEYLLKLFLYFYYKRYQDAVFKGGTCLKFLFGLDRFSEDLDFNIKNSTKFKRQIRTVMKDISGLGINNYFLKEESFEDSYTCEIGFEGPLYKGTKQTQNKFRLDAGYRAGTF